jgi:hypothetical protein
MFVTSMACSTSAENSVGMVMRGYANAAALLGSRQQRHHRF